MVDEWTAFYASLTVRQASLVDDLLAQLILKGRQAGIFLIVAMQRPDGEYLSTNLRDNMMARMSLGKLSKTGYRMVFGEDYEDKNYLFIKSKIGRGYAALDGGMPSEFFSPLIPFDKGFSFEAAFAQMEPLETDIEKVPQETLDKSWTLSELAEELKLSVTTLTRVKHYLSEAGYVFELPRKFTHSDREKFLQVIQRKNSFSHENWKEAVSAVMKSVNREENRGIFK
jgi:DNA-binding transcriptional regulator YhcF (GntR family)